MFAIRASYRGRSRRRGSYVRDVAEALGKSSSVISERVLSVEDFVCVVPGPEEAGGVVMSLLQTGGFAIGIGSVISTDAASNGELDYEDLDEADYNEEIMEELIGAASRALAPKQRASVVSVRVEKPGSGGVLAPGKAAEIAEDVAAAFTLLAHVLSRRTKEGREATALLRAGHLQSEAAEMVGITKQAMSQRLAAAGWQAEQAGWTLAVHTLARIEEM
ncbi:DNA-binding protein [Corynebacterium sp. 4HC-13]|uniref:DNA-binding protein n=1 Tax=Corynebacterium anserum TaxID=2684406 RepID=UPI001639FA02|nr:DNA-binding protein [Corynebacterium anserum]MBC2681562.1 DNA-binding protein [Corynebacterium anserum]